jgi:hypothetical protein
MNKIIIFILLYIVINNNLKSKYNNNLFINIRINVKKIINILRKKFNNYCEYMDENVVEHSNKINTDEIKAKKGIYNEIYTKNLVGETIYNNTLNNKKINTNEIKAKKGIYNDIYTENLVGENIFNNTLNNKKINTNEIKAKDGIYNDISTENLISTKIESTNANIKNLKSQKGEIDNLDSILIYSTQLISDNNKSNIIESKELFSDNIKSNIIEAKDISITSDKRLKKNILYNNVSSNFLDNIDISTFEYINDDINHIGFIAQDIQEYYPQLINVDENGYLSIKYLEMIPLLLDYNKNLKKKIIDIEEKIKLI